mmetsp:Transcript_5599/g.11184  ORF Transcript_5599/g.11184 Transcript_5599/m.11184 type:complete len:312 (-) Transcript_5599:802-1737(-)
MVGNLGRAAFLVNQFMPSVKILEHEGLLAAWAVKERRLLPPKVLPRHPPRLVIYPLFAALICGYLPVSFEVILVHLLHLVVLDLGYLPYFPCNSLGPFHEQPELPHFRLLHLPPVFPNDSPVNIELVAAFLRRDVFPQGGHGPPADFLHRRPLPAKSFNLFRIPHLKDFLPEPSHDLVLHPVGGLQISLVPGPRANSPVPPFDVVCSPQYLHFVNYVLPPVPVQGGGALHVVQPRVQCPPLTPEHVTFYNCKPPPKAKMTEPHQPLLNVNHLLEGHLPLDDPQPAHHLKAKFLGRIALKDSFPAPDESFHH